MTAHLEREMLHAATEPVPVRRITVGEELVRAQKVQGEANQIIRDIMKDVRLGKQVTLEQAEPVVEKLTDSILRNGGALLSLCRVKNKDDYTFPHSVSVCAKV